MLTFCRLGFPYSPHPCILASAGRSIACASSRVTLFAVSAARALYESRGKVISKRLFQVKLLSMQAHAAGNYFKEWVDVKGAYADKGYVSKAELPTALPFLVLVVLGLVGAIGFVVTQTSAPPSPSASAAAEQRSTLSREQREEYGLR